MEYMDSILKIVGKKLKVGKINVYHYPDTGLPHGNVYIYDKDNYNAACILKFDSNKKLTMAYYSPHITTKVYEHDVEPYPRKILELFRKIIADPMRKQYPQAEKCAVCGSYPKVRDQKYSMIMYCDCGMKSFYAETLDKAEESWGEVCQTIKRIRNQKYNTTELEDKLLLKIADTEYSHYDWEKPRNENTELVTWASAVLGGKSRGGVMASLTKKGLAWLQRDDIEKDETTVGLTEIGYYIVYKLKRNPYYKSKDKEKK